MRPPRQSAINQAAGITLFVAVPILGWSGLVMHGAMKSVASARADRAFAMQMIALLLFFAAWTAIIVVYRVFVVSPVRHYLAALATPNDGMPELKPCGSVELRNLAEAYNARVAEAASIHESLRNSEARLQLHLSLMPLGAIEMDSGFRITRWNQAAERIFGWQASEALGADVVELLVPEASRKEIREMLDSLRGGSSMESNVNANLRSDGLEILCEWYNTAIYDGDGELFGWASIVKDVTKERREADRILYLSTHDSLTGLRNRRYGQERLDDESLRSGRSGAPYSVAIFDVDHFKRFNDVYGHECGDVVLRGLSDAMVASVRETDVVSRWGGEEFLVLFPNTGKAGAADAAEKIRARIEAEDFSYGGETLKVTITAGVASSADGNDAEVCVRRADMALLSGKAKGRNVVVTSEVL